MTFFLIRGPSNPTPPPPSGQGFKMELQGLHLKIRAVLWEFVDFVFKNSLYRGSKDACAFVTFLVLTLKNIPNTNPKLFFV